MKRVAACLALATLALSGGGSQPGLAGTLPAARSSAAVGTAGSTAPAARHALGLGPATVSVAVAAVWRHASSPRAVDAPALANPVRIREWLDAMSLDQRRALSGRADTQALLGERVNVLAVSGRWARVVVPGQPSPLDARGYPGWLPVRQLVAGAPAPGGTKVTVVTPTAWLYDAAGARLLKVSFGTRLAALRQSGTRWLVVLPDGRQAQVASSRVATRPLPATAPSVVAAARQFLGLSYLWAGTSGFGFDCSGVMEIVYRVHGIRIPRDAAAQATAGTPVRRHSLRAGDLVFFARGGQVHHVGMYLGNGLMLHAPHTGSRVKIVALWASALADEYAGARRFLP